MAGGKAEVVVLRTRPETVLADYDRLLAIAEFYGPSGPRANLPPRTAAVARPGQPGQPAPAPPGGELILKLNLSWTRYFPACSTAPWQLEGVLASLLGHGFRPEDLIPVENRTVVTDPDKGARRNGWAPVFDRYGLAFRPLTRERWVPFRPRAKLLVLDKIFPEGFAIPELFIGRPILHLPTMKTHGHSVTTGAVKNAFGGLLREVRHFCHAHIHETLADLMTIQREIHPSVWGVMDGTVAGNGAGPRTMVPVVKNLILASADSVALDAVAAKIMGYDPLAIPYLRLCEDMGLGVADPAGSPWWATTWRPRTSALGPSGALLSGATRSSGRAPCGRPKASFSGPAWPSGPPWPRPCTTTGSGTRSSARVARPAFSEATGARSPKGTSGVARASRERDVGGRPGPGGGSGPGRGLRPGRSSASLRRGTVLAVALLVVSLAAVSLFADTRQLAGLARAFDRRFLLPIFLLAPANYVFRFYKWTILLRRANIPVPGGLSLVVFLAGLSMTVTPAKAGELIKSHYLRETVNVPYVTSSPVVVAERILDSASVLILAILGAWAGLLAYRFGPLVIGLSALGLAAVVAVFRSRQALAWPADVLERLPAIGRGGSGRAGKSGLGARLGGFVRAFGEQSGTILDARTFAWCTAVGVVSWSLEGLVVYFTLAGPGYASPPLLGVFVVALASLAGAISLIPGGAVAAEATILGLLLLYGFPRPVAAAATIVMRLATLWLGVAVGLVGLALAEREVARRGQRR